MEVTGGEKSTSVLAAQPTLEIRTVIVSTLESLVRNVHLKPEDMAQAGILNVVTAGWTTMGASTDHGITATPNVKTAGTDGSKFSPNTLNQSVGVGLVKAGFWPRIT